ncbi:unnamed protein product (macronuclear) [Paramecium tetraurelia]|uniref:Uncharacterized protein n=1 Tax=Paramecium tetraurelia TaxID=5888 RepID=A0EBG6_PARTE|nr:uncharacterized protein GSPATT00025367001 [Paramecium tetraurelia]CAK92633.1 unnamed protein product [Paramecium tetraurelia]|eukprot:XP_001460030.1 hypothetical protein (macronuclear) [Paramecium tetraurelia strain d4-2]
MLYFNYTFINFEMIYSQQTLQENKEMDLQGIDTSEHPLAQLQSLKTRYNQERQEFVLFMQEYIVDCLTYENQEIGDDVVQTIKNICQKMVLKPLWNYEDLIVELEQQLETQTRMQTLSIFNIFRRLYRIELSQFNHFQFRCIILKQVQLNKYPLSVDTKKPMFYREKVIKEDEPLY